MGIAKEIMIERQQEELERKIAGILGISYNELCIIGYEINTDENEDGQIYNYIIEFPEEASSEILDKINGLEDRKRVWLQPWELYEDDSYYDEQYEAILQNNQYYSNFHYEIQNLQKLNDLKIEDSGLQQILKKQIYIGCVGILETFLSDTLINLTTNDDEYFRNFITSHPKFRQHKFELREIFEQTDKLKDTAKKVMLDTIYHDLRKVREIYLATFKTDFPEIRDILKFILIRHDLVHRNGKTKQDILVNINKKDVNDVLKRITTFVDDLANNLNLIRLDRMVENIGLI